MPFKQYKIIGVKPIGHSAPGYRGFFTEDMMLTDKYAFTVLVRTWWGLKKKTCDFPFACNANYDVRKHWERDWKGKWISKLPFKN